MSIIDDIVTVKNEYFENHNRHPKTIGLCYNDGVVLLTEFTKHSGYNDDVKNDIQKLLMEMDRGKIIKYLNTSMIYGMGIKVTDVLLKSDNWKHIRMMPTDADTIEIINDAGDRLNYKWDNGKWENITLSPQLTTSGSTVLSIDDIQVSFHNDVITLQLINGNDHAEYSVSFTEIKKINPAVRTLSGQFCAAIEHAFRECKSMMLRGYK